MSQIPLKTTFEPTQVIQPYFSGGPGNTALDATGRLLATACEDEAVLTDLRTGAELARIDGDGQELTTLAMTPSGSHLVTCSRSYLMCVYALAPEIGDDSVKVEVEKVRQTKMGAPAMVAECDPTGTLVAIGGSDGIVKVWDIVKGFVTHNLRGHGGLVSALAFYMDTEGASKGGRFRLATGGDDTTVRVWDLEKAGKSLATLKGHTSVVRGLDWSKDGARLLSGARDGAMCLWDTKTWKFVVTAAGEEVEAVGFVAPGMFEREDGGEADRLVFAAGRKDRVRVWDLVEGVELTAKPDEDEEEDEEKGVIQIIYHKNLPKLWSIHRDFTIHEHALRLPTPAPTTLPITARLTTNYDEIIDCCYLPPSQSQLAIATNSEDVRIVSTESFHDVALLQGHTDTVLTLAHDWSGRWLATAGKDNNARLWDLDTFTCAAVFTGHAESIAALALPRSRPQDGSHAAADRSPPAFLLTGGADRTIKKWDIAPGAPKQRALFTRRAHEKDINAIDVSPDDKLFASASQDRTIKIWDTAACETVGVLRGHRRAVWSVQFAPAGVTASVLGGADGTRAGTLLVSGSTDRTVKLWSLADFSCLRTLEGHTNSIQRVLFLNGGTQVASAGNDGLIKLWSVRTSECVATLDNHSTRIWALAATPSSGRLLSADAAGIITVWRDTTAAVAAAAAVTDAAAVEEAQALSNAVAARDWRRAITLALALNHPGQLLHLLTTVTTSPAPDAGSLTGSAGVDEVLASLADSQLATLLLRIRDWNTNARTAAVAQRVLHALLRSYPAERLGRLRGTAEVWAVLEAYTKRHVARVEEMEEGSWVVGYLLGGMEQVGTGVGEGEGERAVEVV
ncbi:WD40-repeat-containing domain protein [Geopyxis carbonaria]|nr:WD40-repeat-containing domain protein [Geopyxis carbonaria]